MRLRMRMRLAAVWLPCLARALPCHTGPLCITFKTCDISTHFKVIRLPRIQQHWEHGEQNRTTSLNITQSSRDPDFRSFGDREPCRSMRAPSISSICYRLNLLLPTTLLVYCVPLPTVASIVSIASIVSFAYLPEPLGLIVCLWIRASSH